MDIRARYDIAMTEPGNRVEQPTPFSTPGEWTITTVNGLKISGYLPAWAEDDPSEADVPLDLLPLRLAAVGHRSFFEGQMVHIVTPGSDGEAEEDAVFEGSIDCTPYAADPGARVPVVNIQVCPGYGIHGLDPAGVAEVAMKLRAQADLLDHEVGPALMAARTDWAAHRPVPG